MERQLQAIQPILDVPFIRRVRRNHGLEHATIHLLSRKVENLRVIGRSDAGGFWLYGDVDTTMLRSAADDALRRMRGGEHKLAIHPNCGTNLVTIAFLGAVATLIALMGAERERMGKLSRLPMIMMGIMLSVVFGQSIGAKLQEHVTTLGDPGDLEILEVKSMVGSSVPLHRVLTRSS
ncbi:MAG: hypothetical protein GYB68_11655 [Chloroflexi bacterium]|nr:hypothetical protein [Chloroflexota bacterium]